MRMLARPPVAVTAVLHLGDSWKQALKLPNLTPFHVLSQPKLFIFKAQIQQKVNHLYTDKVLIVSYSALKWEILH